MEYLQGANKAEFDNNDIENIEQLLVKDYKAYYPQPIEYTPYEDLVLLIGFLDIEKSIPKLESLILPNSDYQRKWEVYLTLARLGHKKAIEYCVSEVTNSRSKHYSNLKDFCYIRQPEVIEVLNEYLFDDKYFSDNREECPSTLDFIFGLYARTVKGFPIDYDTNNKKSVEVVRTWVIENKGKYIMNRDIF
jgi:hypothetical protein